MGEISHGLNSIAIAYMGICGVCFLYILWVQRKRPAPMMRIMLWVWPVNALWAGPFGVWAYRAMAVQAYDADQYGLRICDSLAYELVADPYGSQVGYVTQLEQLC